MWEENCYLPEFFIDRQSPKSFTTYLRATELTYMLQTVIMNNNISDCLLYSKTLTDTYELSENDPKWWG